MDRRGRTVLKARYPNIPVCFVGEGGESEPDQPQEQTSSLKQFFVVRRFEESELPGIGPLSVTILQDAARQTVIREKYGNPRWYHVLDRLRQMVPFGFLYSTAGNMQQFKTRLK